MEKNEDGESKIDPDCPDKSKAAKQDWHMRSSEGNDQSKNLTITPKRLKKLNTMN